MNAGCIHAEVPGSDMLALIAMITMLIDHIGLLFFPDDSVFRVIGRIAFPLYCWFLVQGYRHTRHLGRYMRRLLALACLSQVPFTLATGKWELNVIFTLLVCLTALYTIDRVQPEWRKLLGLSAILCLIVWMPMDYGPYGFMLAIVYRYFDKWKLLLGHLLVNSLFWSLHGHGYEIQLYSLLGSLLIILPLPERLTANYRWIYRSFYPAHLTLLYLIAVSLRQI